ncbi:hypothetical protein [Streptomyces sp. NPDC002533]
MLAECGVLREEGHDDGRGGVDLVLELTALVAAPAELVAELGEFGVALLFPEAGGTGSDPFIPLGEDFGGPVHRRSADLGLAAEVVLGQFPSVCWGLLVRSRSIAWRRACSVLGETLTVQLF